ncbi:MAG: S46 family peptidase [Pseudomonadota bacterium]
MTSVNAGSSVTLLLNSRPPYRFPVWLCLVFVIYILTIGSASEVCAGEGLYRPKIWPIPDTKALETKAPDTKAESALQNQGVGQQDGHIQTLIGGSFGEQVSEAPPTYEQIQAIPLDAVGKFGGCSGGFISPDGLFITNHHCILQDLQFHSRSGRMDVQAGFAAQDQLDELPAIPGRAVEIIKEIRDVSDRLDAETRAGMSDGIPENDAFLATVRTVQDECEAKALTVSQLPRPDEVRCVVLLSAASERYYLTRSYRYHDVRLVFAPPIEFARLGGRRDNFQWPRLNADFALMRVYAAQKDGSILPLPTTRARLAVRAPKAGEPISVAGFPGRTERFQLADKTRHFMRWRYPAYLKLFEQWETALLGALETYPDATPEYLVVRSRVANEIKLRTALIDAQKRHNLVSRARARDQRRVRWQSRSLPRIVNGRLRNAERRLKRSLKAEFRDVMKDFGFSGLSRSALWSYAIDLYEGAHLRETMGGSQNEMGERKLSPLTTQFDPRVDFLIWKRFVRAYASGTGANRDPGFDKALGLVRTYHERTHGPRLERIYKSSELLDPERRDFWRQATTAEFRQSKDEFLSLAIRLARSIEDRRDPLATIMGTDRFQFLRGLNAFRRSEGKPIYDDADRSLRFSFGIVDFANSDQTKAATTQLENLIPKARKEVPQAEWISPLAEEALTSPALSVAFRSTVDGTGGSSGSLTFDAKGRVIGILFDGIYDRLGANWDYEASPMRSVHLSTLMILKTLDVFAPNSAVLAELNAQSGLDVTHRDEKGGKGASALVEDPS